MEELVNTVVVVELISLPTVLHTNVLSIPVTAPLLLLWQSHKSILVNENMWQAISQRALVS